MVGAQGQTKWAKVAKKSSTYDVTHKKKRTPKQKIFFRVQSTRLADPFELSSAIGGGARVLVRQPKTAVFFCENCRNQAALKVLIGLMMMLLVQL